MRALRSLLALAFTLLVSRAALAFCGFYVSGADTKLVNPATHVALMRAGTRTVLSMQNAYEGPPEDFALVVPVPVVLQKDQVKTLARDVLDHVDQLGAPRLVEYWEQDPCAQEAFGGLGLSGIGQGGGGFGSGHGRLSGSHAVKVEAEFAVGEYDVVILSATDSTALDAWLRENHYKIPAGAEPYLAPYVKAGMKFFVAKVNIAKVTMKDGRAVLSPLRFHYDSETFSLPIRLGLINAEGAQDLIVSILSYKQRYELANYPNATIPTNLDVSEAARESFGSFYAALFDDALKQKPGAAITEYAWDAGTCDPCPGPALTSLDIGSLGADVLPEDSGPAAAASVASSPGVQVGSATVTGRLPPEVIQRIVRQYTGRFRLCYEDGLRKKPRLKGRLVVNLDIDRKGNVSKVEKGESDLDDDGVTSCVFRAMRELSFPEPEGGPVTATLPLSFSHRAYGVTGVVLTRIHMRYSRDALGEDLVFKEAAAIQGGRERRSEDGALETGAAAGEVNNFQARYAIRHPWAGPVACDKPRRGVWGGPPEGAQPKPMAARDTAFVKRGASLATFMSGAPPAASAAAGTSSATAPVPAASAAPASSASAPGAKGGCTCRAAPPAGRGAWLTALVLGAVLAARRRKRRSPY